MVDRFLARVGRDGSAADAPKADGRSATLAPPTDPVAAVWATVQLARNLRRPRTLELLGLIADEFIELHGDRLFGDDTAMVAGLARIGGRRVVVIGQQKGAETDENIRRNFGMPHPEGYRKSMRLMELAERLGIPVVTFIDVPGAHPGPESEERGIAESIARSVALMSRLRTPIVAVITGEGGSGGALAIAVGDVVIALENAVYSVISPEGCAAILWRDPEQAATAAAAMKMTAMDQVALGVVDLVVEEPEGGAQNDPAATAARLKEVIVAQLELLEARPLDELIEARYRRYRSLGPFATIATAEVPPPERPGLADRLRNFIGGNRAAVVLPPPVRPSDEPPPREED